jgi:outer membrane scaffolding protein for murein synthesis (MipA/OmpV family)
MKNHSLIKPILAIAFAAACQGAQAQAFDAVRLFGKPTGDGEGSVGAAVIAAHQYMGSDERRTVVLPVLDYRWANGWFVGTGNGVGYLFDSAPNVQYGVRLTADFGRDEGRSPVLAGMGDIKARPEIGAFLNYLPTREIFVTSSLRYGAGNDRNGLQVDLGAGYALQLTPQWRAAAGVAATLVNREAMQEYFGVTPAQSLTSGHAAYSAGAGLRDVRANLSVNYFITPAWTATAAVTVSSLEGDAKNSPIVRERTSTTGLAALSYRF